MRAIPMVFSAVLIQTLAGCLVQGAAGDFRRLHPDDDGTIRGTGLEANDARTIAQQMARSLLGDTRIADRARPPRIHVLPVRNRTRFRIDTEVFSSLLTNLLIENAEASLAFVFQEDGPLSTREAPAATRADYLFAGEIHSLSKASTRGVADYVVYRYQLVNVKDQTIVWSHAYESNKEGTDGVVYR